MQRGNMYYLLWSPIYKEDNWELVLRIYRIKHLEVSHYSGCIWGWDINPLVPGWGTGPEKTRFPKCLGFALDWNLVFFWFLVPGWFLNSQIRPPERIVYTSRFWTGKPNCCNDHIYHSHASESLNLIFFNLKGGGGTGGNYYLFIQQPCGQPRHRAWIWMWWLPCG